MPWIGPCACRGLSNAWTMPIKARIDMLATGIKTPVGIKVAGPSLPELERIASDRGQDPPGARDRPAHLPSA
jgi:Cu/Ag efflux pump CusA